ncbi:hypothetical protein [Amycolatopsis anabasis]|uniref:hypothetical protein n=1 Tax=Amycolatopsis anabasis TaxID=1840409 RepID=UPI00131E3C10|nr:hypothetical protein [Amycolatopsis anabasis]
MSPSLDRLLDRCASHGGRVLSPDERRRVHALDRAPSTATWSVAFTILLASEGARRTLWQAVGAIDRRCPLPDPTVPARHLIDARRWRGYFPSRLTLRIALRDASANLAISATARPLGS